ncbi:hypothetical protein L486_06020 [Kwoniella mangroviensis CBS 10435]|uniref:Small ribosomal subunit protein mS41 n=2 Tax=Kwoniella mangrovensis TaxID=463800 RepID=A0A1B9IK79_9TREE|nr:uncharacterized protein I203_05728 [Kwoniella mangroviensis CBS 8507]OCF56079.1 hypothetical protein L486_06020 [Kwoniella mangroviensis CBS 10435]OCF64986.1 hypothetical protein I203_05728 [Kwoniella mangroviensis CBS 8507]OCF78829.1 hypothetical protein I204_00773 [Kwoniella mangroviensis CBS 8886]
MFLPSLRASSSKLPSAILNSRMISSTTRVMNKAPLRASAETPTPQDLLSKIGRNADTKLEAFAESWEKLNELWMRTVKLYDVGLSVKERRYLLWAFSRYSQGSAPSTFIRPPRPPKKFRG